MSNASGTSSAATAAMVAAVFMIAHQVAAKATRDALFFSNFDVTALPTMLIGASLLAIASVVVSSRMMTRLGPARLMPPAFGLSAALMLCEWQVVEYSPRLGAVAIYAHIAAFGSILISGFWSLVNEHFDPRAARRLVARIGTGGTIGGLAGGLLTGFAADSISVTTMVPLLAGMHGVCSLILFQLKPREKVTERVAPSDPDETPYRSGVRVLHEQPYLRNLALLILLGTISAALIDYVFKARVSATLEGDESFLRFFAFYYTVIGICSVVVQSSLSGFSLKRFGLAKTVGTLPSVVALGSVGAALAPIVPTAVVARGAEAVVRNSLFRSAYEVLYTPVPLEEKRATKSIIDVGFERIGDTLGGGLARLILFLVPQIAQSAMLLLAFLLAMVGFYVARKLHQGYVTALERSLKAKAVELDISEIEDKTTRQTMMLTMADLQLDRKLVAQMEDSRTIQSGGTSTSVQAPLDPTLREIAELTSGDPERIRQILRTKKPPETSLIPFIVNLLAWDQVALDAIRSLRLAADTITGQLVDALTNPSQEFSIRRRIPRVLSAALGQRAADGLMLGLRDPRFEVRFQCSRALAKISERAPKVHFQAEAVYAAAAREVAVDRRVWESHRLLDQFEETEETAFFEDQYLQERAGRSLEHVFTILSLVLPREPLRIAYRGLHTEDKNLRGTALEYLETILPEEIRNSLWPFLEQEGKKETLTKSREQILEELMQSNKSIEISLEQIRKHSGSDS